MRMDQRILLERLEEEELDPIRDVQPSAKGL